MSSDMTAIEANEINKNSSATAVEAAKSALMTSGGATGGNGGTVPSNALSGHFCESSKSDEKNLAVWGVTSSSIFGCLLNKVTKSIVFSQARLFYFNHLCD